MERATEPLFKRARVQVDSDVESDDEIDAGVGPRPPLRFCTAVPDTVYQSALDASGRLNSRQPLVLRLRVACPAAAALLDAHGAKAVQLIAVRADGVAVEMWCKESRRCRPMPPPAGSGEWDSANALLTIGVNRVTLPLSIHAGNSPFVFVVKVGSAGAVSTPFFCLSKERRSVSGAVTTKKRVVLTPVEPWKPSSEDAELYDFAKAAVLRVSEPPRV